MGVGNFNFNINGFDAGDRIVSPMGVAGTLHNSSPNDATATLQYGSGGQTVNVTLTGLTTAQDGALVGLADFNTVFGAGTFV